MSKEYNTEYSCVSLSFVKTIIQGCLIKKEEPDKKSLHGLCAKTPLSIFPKCKGDVTLKFKDLQKSFKVTSARNTECAQANSPRWSLMLYVKRNQKRWERQKRKHYFGCVFACSRLSLHTTLTNDMFFESSKFPDSMYKSILGSQYHYNSRWHCLTTFSHTKGPSLQALQSLFHAKKIGRTRKILSHFYSLLNNGNLFLLGILPSCLCIKLMRSWTTHQG